MTEKALDRKLHLRTYFLKHKIGLTPVLTTFSKNHEDYMKKYVKVLKS